MAYKIKQIVLQYYLVFLSVFMFIVTCEVNNDNKVTTEVCIYSNVGQVLPLHSLHNQVFLKVTPQY